MKKTTLTLPDKLSDLLELAVHDCLEAELDPNVTLSMGTWFAPSIGRGGCSACMAGAIMYRQNGPYVPLLDMEAVYTDATADKLNAIDFMRHGYFISACVALGIYLALNKEQSVMCFKLYILLEEYYSFDPDRAPWHVYLECVDRLRSVGL